jgi:3-deoxy-D-manno-octulosonic-acid transferase
MAKFLKIKIFFINANLYKQSNRLKFPFKNFNKLLFKQFDKILSPSKRISKNINELVNSNIVKTTGDSRFDQINQRMKKNKFIFFKNTTNQSKKIIMGSILKSDYKIIFNFLKTYFPNGDKSLMDKKIKLIIVPHEVDRQSVSELQKKLKKISIISKLYSSEQNNNLPNSLIVDKIGILADLYKYADFVYIGGGFEAGVHSVIEPSIYGSIITYGPNINILDEAVEMTKKKIGFIVKNHLELINYFNFVNDEEKILNIKKLTKNYVMKNTGASRKIITELFN